MRAEIQRLANEVKPSVGRVTKEDLQPIIDEEAEL
jgi:hypothetical protein